MGKIQIVEDYGASDDVAWEDQASRKQNDHECKDDVYYQDGGEVVDGGIEQANSDRIEGKTGVCEVAKSGA